MQRGAIHLLNPTAGCLSLGINALNTVWGSWQNVFTYAGSGPLKDLLKPHVFAVSLELGGKKTITQEKEFLCNTSKVLKRILFGGGADNKSLSQGYN